MSIPVSIKSLALLFGGWLALFSVPSRADMDATGTSDQTNYVRGATNRFTFHLNLISSVYEGADTIQFGVPAGVTLSAVHFLEGFHQCPDSLLLVLGMGSQEGGWYNPGYPSGCGHFGGAPAPGEPQSMTVDVDVPAAYTGDLPVVVTVQGDECCDPPPHVGIVDVTFTDAGSPVRWNFDDVPAPALPVGWTTTTAGAGVPWQSQSDSADTSPNAAHAAAPSASGEADLVGPAIAIPAAGGELHFRQRFDTDASKDGGVLEIAVDGGAFEDIVAAGGSFNAGGYNGAMSTSADCSGANANPLAGRAGWTGAQGAFAPVAVTLPSTTFGHTVQFRWRLGTDCTGGTTEAGGWWIDDVAITSDVPLAAIGPSKIAVATPAGVQRIERLGIGNSGGGSLGYSIATAAEGASDCSTPGGSPWLHLAATSGSVAGGAQDEISVQFDTTSLATGTHSALLCVTTNDTSTPPVTVPLTLDVTQGACAAVDRVFANGFDDASDGACGRSLRTFDNREAFVSSVANGYSEEHYTGLRSGYLYGPIAFGNGTYTYSVFTQDGAAAGLYLFAGSGVLSSTSAQDHLVITFTGAPVTAVGGNVWGQLFFSNSSVQTNTTPATTIVLTLDDGTVESFVADGPDDFRGFVSTSPIRQLTIATPDADADGDFVWGVIDNLIVGSAR